VKKINDPKFEGFRHSRKRMEAVLHIRWRITGRNKGLLGTPADQQRISFTGTAVGAVNQNARLSHNWVERSFLS
jgi:hypothetical protein